MPAVYPYNFVFGAAIDAEAVPVPEPTIAPSLQPGTISPPKGAAAPDRMPKDVLPHHARAFGDAGWCLAPKTSSDGAVTSYQNLLSILTTGNGLTTFHLENFVARLQAGQDSYDSGAL